MPFRAGTPFLRLVCTQATPAFVARINALSGWNSISTLIAMLFATELAAPPYQCPFGLELHFYDKISEIKKMYIGYQCPFGLELHFYVLSDSLKINVLCRINALSGWNSISTVPLRKPRFYAVSGACFCRYLSEYSDNGHFSCMLTI